MRYLVRGAINPLSNMNQAKFIIENHTGTNIGNMIFLNSIVRTLLVDDDTAMDFINLRRIKITEEYIEKVNSTYDAFLIPLANAFKKSFYKELIILTKFIKKLRIPCHIIGVGIQQILSSKPFETTYEYNNEVKEFVAAILEKSPMIGVRGQLTADYLQAIGFVPEKDFTVIGCPSMFTFGAELPQLKNTSRLTPNSVVAFNSKKEFEKLANVLPFIKFTGNSMREFPHYVYIMQQINDVEMIYLDSMNDEARKDKFYDVSRAVSFTNIPSWLEFMNKNIDFAFGNRIHGNVAAVLAGVPTVVVPCDKRVLELADYHNIPSISLKAIEKTSSLAEIYEKADFSSIYNGHEERFRHYLDFLRKLGLDTIYDHEYKDGKTPFDIAQEKVNYFGIVRDYSVINQDEKINRYKEAYTLLKSKK